MKRAQEIKGELAAIPDNALVKGGTLTKLVDMLTRLVPLPGRNMTRQETADGVRLNAARAVEGWRYGFRIDLTEDETGWTCQPGVVFYNGNLIVPTYPDADSTPLGTPGHSEVYTAPGALTPKAWYLEISTATNTAEIKYGDNPIPDSTSALVRVYLAAILDGDTYPYPFTGGTLQLFGWTEGGTFHVTGTSW